MTDELKQILRVIGGTKGDHCAYPVQIDMAGKGCTGGCKYCYAQSLLAFRGLWDDTDPAAVDTAKVRKLFEDAFDLQKDTKDAKALRECGALRIGGMTDPLLHNRDKTHELLELCVEYNLPHLLFTKGLLEPTLAFLDRDLTTVQLSIGTLNEEWLRKCEPGAPSASQRLQSIDASIAADIRTIVRVAPIIPVEELYNDRMLSEICSHRPDGIIGETIRYSGMIAKQMMEIGFDCKQCEPDHLEFKRGQYVYSVEMRDALYTNMLSMCDHHGIPFSVCENDGFDFFKKYWKGIYNNCCMG